MAMIRRKLASAAAALLAGAMLMGCAALPAVLSTTTPINAQQSPAPEVTMPPTNTPPSRPLTPRATVRQRDSSQAANAARSDLAQRLNIPEDQIEVVSVEKTEMPLGSLGCGATGGSQNQGLIIGDEIVLQAAGQEYVYRSGSGKTALCSPATTPGEQQTPPAAAHTAEPTAQDLAVADLAGRLGIAPTAITVREVLEAEWPDASLGCPQPEMMYAQVITYGQRILLEASGRTYEYHAARGYVILCRP